MSDGASVVVEAGLLLQLELLEQNLLKSDLGEPLIFEDEDLRVDCINIQCDPDSIKLLAVILLVFHRRLGTDACEKGLVSTVRRTVEQSNFAVHLLTKTLAHVQAEAVLANVVRVKCLNRLEKRIDVFWPNRWTLVDHADR